MMFVKHILLCYALITLVNCQNIIFQEKEVDCNCMRLTECSYFIPLIQDRNFQKIKEEMFCGFEAKTPRYCCEDMTEIMSQFSTTTTLSPVSVSGRIDLSEDVDLRSSAEDFDLFENLIDEETFFKNLSSACGTSFDDNLNHKYPWLVALIYEDSDQNSQRVHCAGVIISHEVILTAAHCNDTIDNHRLKKVRIGHGDINDNEAIDIDIEEILVHPNYTESLYHIENDLAMLKLNQALKFNRDITPICLPNPDSENFAINENDQLIVAGWGTMNMSTPESDLLREQAVKNIRLDTCLEEFDLFYGSASTIDDELCIRNTENQDFCSVDSGGPLMTILESRRHTLVGISSLRKDPCDASVPIIYTPVSLFLDWIRSFMMMESWIPPIEYETNEDFLE